MHFKHFTTQLLAPHLEWVVPMLCAAVQQPHSSEFLWFFPGAPALMDAGLTSHCASAEMARRNRSCWIIWFIEYIQPLMPSSESWYMLPLSYCPQHQGKDSFSSFRRNIELWCALEAAKQACPVFTRAALLCHG